MPRDLCHWLARLLGRQPQRPAGVSQAKRILFLDDDPARHRDFDRAHRTDEVTHCFTAADAMQVLDDSPPFDELHLDHDLGGRIFVTEVKETGYEVVLHVARLPKERLPARVVIHTHNLNGARRMMECLGARVPVSHIPF